VLFDSGGAHREEASRQLAAGVCMRISAVRAFLAPLTVFGRNIVCEGIELVFARSGLAAARQSAGFMELGNRFAGRPRIFVGPPLSFDSTIMSYFAFDPSAEKAAEIFDRLHSQIRPRRIRFPIKSPAPLAVVFGMMAKFRRRKN
jgi:hypothetical protein